MDTDTLQLQVGGRRGTSSLQMLMLQPRQGRVAKELQSALKATRGRISLPATPPQDYPSPQFLAATHSDRGSIICPRLHRPAPLQWEK